MEPWGFCYRNVTDISLWPYCYPPDRCFFFHPQASVRAVSRGTTCATPTSSSRPAGSHKEVSYSHSFPLTRRVWTGHVVTPSASLKHTNTHTRTRTHTNATRYIGGPFTRGVNTDTAVTGETTETTGESGDKRHNGDEGHNRNKTDDRHYREQLEPRRRDNSNSDASLLALLCGDACDVSGYVVRWSRVGLL